MRRRAAWALACIFVAFSIVGVLKPAYAAVGCRVAYTVPSQWQGGFQAAITVTNLGDPLNGWTLGFSFGGDQHVGNVWGATASQSGSAVTLANLPWDAAIAAGATINVVGMTGTWTASDAAPSGFVLNGVRCS